MNTRRSFIKASIAAGLLPLSTVVARSEYPSRPVKIVVPVSAGGGTDGIARFLARGLEAELGQPFVVENRPGAGGVIATRSVASAQPDGYSLLLGSISTLAMAPGLYRKLPYDPVRDFLPIMLIAGGPFVLVVRPSLGIDNVKELIAFASGRPDQLSYASAGPGSPHHIFAELFMRNSDIRMRHVPYRGGALALADVTAGHVSMMFADAGVAQDLIRLGTLKPLGVTTSKRLDILPDVPTLEEAGMPGFDVNVWQMLVAPAMTPMNIVMQLNSALSKLMLSPQAIAHFRSVGMVANSGTVEEANVLVRDEVSRWAQVIGDLSIELK